ncbi:FAD-binding oxidoreductase [Thiomonas delicata]|uniref:Putative D-lactate dehydrogenase n=1 Tax=Thiomonas delicata TaxID=364030 RepID=A0A238D7Z8_THIDL|nr:FAD-binding oxidoreductase [Thiomonas delicata]SBP89349.1 putative D-lactate dehydrogenase [Thiomonas delicata]
MNKAERIRFLDALRALLGASHVLSEAHDLAPYATDWRKRYHGKPMAVAMPGDTAQVAEVVQLCATHRVPIVPQGGNTGLVGGATTDASGTELLLSLRRMNRIRDLSTADGVLVAEAGCVLAAVQQAADGAGMLFPLSLAAEGSATVGGVLSTNAGGTAVLRYGNARSLCLGLEVVTPQGQIWNGLSALRKDNTGYDLRDLFIGAEGTLGLITAASLQLFARPAARRTAMALVAHAQDAVDLLQQARGALGAGLTGFELMSAHSLQLVQRHFPRLRLPLELSSPWCVLLELSDNEGEAHAQARLEAVLGLAMEQGRVVDAAVAQTLAQAQAMWALREHIPLAQAQEGLNIKHDIAVPISRMAAFVESTAELVTQALPGARLVVFGHLGDGNLHYNVQAPLGGDAADFLARHQDACNRIVHDAAAACGGSFSAEHGVGQLKLDDLLRYKSPVAVAMMRAIKAALDPQGLMNPGKVLRP